MSNTAQSPASRRIEGLLDGNSFVEIGGQVTARSDTGNVWPEDWRAYSPYSSQSDNYTQRMGTTFKTA